MALDGVKNFAKVEVSTGYSDTATSIVLSTGEGAKLPDPSTAEYNVTWWNSTDYPDPSDDPNVEIVRVTAKTTDTLTVTRNQESSGASTKNTSGKTYKMVLGITAKMITDIEDNFGGASMTSFVPLPIWGRFTTTNADITVNTTGFTYGFNLPASIIVNKISIITNNAPTISGTLNIGIYSEDGQTKEIDVTTATISSATTVYTTTVSSINLPAGNHWIVVVPNGTTNVQVAVWATGEDNIAVASEPVWRGTQLVTANTLPTTFDPASDISFSSSAKALKIRLD